MFLIVAAATSLGFAVGAIFTDAMIRKSERRRAMEYAKEIIETYKKTNERDRENMYKVWLN
jgi:hypothetical protein